MKKLNSTFRKPWESPLEKNLEENLKEKEPVQDAAGQEDRAKALYAQLCSDEYSERPFEKYGLGDGMTVVNQVMGEYWKPRFLMDNNAKTAFEFMDPCERLTTISAEDIDWSSFKNVPEEAIRRAKRLSAHYPTFVRKFENGIASVDWQINPDGRYFMDEDGYGMTDDEEITVYGYIDRTGKPLVKFRIIKDFEELRRMKQEAIRQTS